MTSKFRKAVDWEAMRPDWVAGIKSVLQLSEEYGVSRAAILKHWGKEGLERDLAGKIKAKADALVTQSLVTSQVTPEGRVTEREVIDVNAKKNAEIQINERKDVSKARSVLMSLFAELESQVANKELYEQLGEMMHSPDDKGIDRRYELYQKVTSFGGRVDSMKKLGEALKTAVELERKVYKIDDTADEESKSQKVSVEVQFL